jgi:probable F420-dependent oxidoreductase
MGHPRPFRFGVQLATARSGAEWADLARNAEDLGYSTLFVPDHFDENLAPVPALAAAAAATTTLKVAPLVLDNDYKHPVVTAKELATIDLLSDGRLEVGLGAGWMASDYERSGIPMDEPGVRVDRLEEGIAVIKGLFGEGEVDFTGDHYQVTGLNGWPKPVQRPMPPFLIGGGRPRTLRLAAREADIVGVNPSIQSGRTDAAAAKDGVAEQTDRKLGWLREAAGDRYDDIEINFLIFACVVTDDRQGTVEAMAPMFGLSPHDVAEYPHAWVGSVDQICEHLEAGRDRWDASYLVVQGVEGMAAAAPIVARLAGN